MEELAEKAFGPDVGGIFFDRFLLLPLAERNFVDGIIGKLMKDVKGKKLKKPEKDGLPPSLVREQEKRLFMQKLDLEIGKVHRLDTIVSFLGKMPDIPTTIESIDMIKQYDSLLDGAEACSDKIDLIIQYKRGMLYATVKETVEFGSTERFWIDLELSPKRVNERIRFYRLMSCFPLLLCLSIGYADYVKYCSDIIARARLDDHFKAKISRDSNMMRIGFAPFEFGEVSANKEFNYVKLGKRKYTELIESRPLLTFEPQQQEMQQQQHHQESELDQQLQQLQQQLQEQQDQQLNQNLQQLQQQAQEAQQQLHQAEHQLLEQLQNLVHDSPNSTNMDAVI